MLGDWAQAGYGDAYRAYQPYYYAQGVANGAYPAGAGAGVGAGGVDQSTTTIGTQIKVRRGLLAAALSGSCVRGRGGWRERRWGGDGGRAAIAAAVTRAGPMLVRPVDPMAPFGYARHDRRGGYIAREQKGCGHEPHGGEYMRRIQF